VRADAAHLLFQVVLPDGLDSERCVEAGFARVAIVVNEVEELLVAASDGMEELGVGGVEHGGRCALSSVPSGNAAGMDLFEGGFPR
jgi:hypothetical protein